MFRAPSRWSPGTPVASAGQPDVAPACNGDFWISGLAGDDGSGTSTAAAEGALTGDDPQRGPHPLAGNWNAQERTMDREQYLTF